MKVVFMGTPDFAVPALKALVEAGHEVAAVISQPDKPKGRGKSVSFPPVKEAARDYKIPVYQPVKVREEGFIHLLEGLGPDVIVVAAFGQILPKSILDLPKYGCINIHGSLLPKLRGAAPIQWAVIEGEEKSGVTTMQMAEGIDTGDMYLSEEVVLDKKETGGSLFEKLSVIGGRLIVKTLKQLESGEAVPVKQDDSQSTYVKMLKKAQGDLDFKKPADELERLIRGLNPWPSAYTFFEGKTLKIWDADVTDGKEDAQPGEIIEVTKDFFCVQTGEGALAIREVQLEGKKRMKSGDFLRGVSLTTGSILSRPDTF